MLIELVKDLRKFGSKPSQNTFTQSSQEVGLGQLYDIIGWGLPVIFFARLTTLGRAKGVNCYL